MDQILDRVRLLIEIIDHGKTLGSDVFDYEVVALNFRKILELIAYSSLVSHHAEYTAAHKNAEKHYKAKDILAEVEKFNPNFYPSPMILEFKSGDKNSPHMLTPSTEDHLTREDFATLYDKCSALIHVQNILKGNQTVDFVHPPKVWLKKITNLLDRHVIVFPSDETRWLVVMSEEKQKAHVYSLGPPENIQQKSA